MVRGAGVDPQVSKAELLDRLQRDHTRLEAVLDRLTPAQLTAPGAIGAWSIKDLLAHLIAHEQRALEEVRSALRDERLEIDHAANDAFNAGAVTAYRALSLAAVREAWEASYRQVVETVATLPDAAFDPSGPVVAALADSIDGALANNTYAHYAEHRRQIETSLPTLIDSRLPTDD
jgi:uncharacterized protein (TIGR03083 family)